MKYLKVTLFFIALAVIFVAINLWKSHQIEKWEQLPLEEKVSIINENRGNDIHCIQGSYMTACNNSYDNVISDLKTAYEENN